MVKRISTISICVILLLSVLALTACTNEADALQERIDELEGENAELQSTVSSLRTELESTQTNLASTQNELQNVLSTLEPDDDDQASQQDTPSGPLAITSYGTPRTDMQWPLSAGEFDALGLYVDWSVIDEDADIVWNSSDEDIFTVASSGDGTSATATPVAVGSAELIVTVGDQETRSWFRIT